MVWVDWRDWKTGGRGWCSWDDIGVLHRRGFAWLMALQVSQETAQFDLAGYEDAQAAACHADRAIG